MNSSHNNLKQDPLSKSESSQISSETNQASCDSAIRYPSASCRGDSRDNSDETLGGTETAISTSSARLKKPANVTITIDENHLRKVLKAQRPTDHSMNNLNNRINNHHGRLMAGRGGGPMSATIQSPRSFRSSAFVTSPNADFANMVSIGEVFDVFRSPTSPLYPAMIYANTGEDFDTIHQNNNNNSDLNDEGAQGSDGAGGFVGSVADLLEPPKMSKHAKVFHFGFTDSLLVSLGTLFAICFGAIMPMSAVIYGLVYSSFQQFQNGQLPVDEFQRRISEYCTYVGIMAAGLFVTGYLRSYCWMLAGIRQYIGIRKRLFRKMILLDIEWFDTEDLKPESNPRYLMSGSLRVQTAFTFAFPSVLSNITTALTSLGLALYFNWKLALVVFGAATGIGLLSVVINRFTSVPLHRTLEYMQKHKQRLAEVFKNFIFILSMNGKTYEIEENEKLVKNRSYYTLKYLQRWSLLSAILNFLVISSYALSYWYGSRLVVSGEITGSVVLQVLMWSILGFESLTRVIDSVPTFLEAKLILKKIQVVLKLNPKISSGMLEAPDAAIGDFNNLDSGMKSKSRLEIGDILFENVKFAYPARPEAAVLDKVTLKIQKGQFTGIVGFSGSGKSTVCQLIQRFYDPASGLITLNGVSLSDLNTVELRSKISVVSQEPFLYNNCSIADNLAMAKGNGKDGKQVTQFEMERACRIAQIHEFIDSLPEKYDTIIQSGTGSGLSGGERQRIVIARAILKNSPIMILDEATSYLDPESEAALLDSLLQYMKGRTVLIITHRFNALKEVDYIYVMSEGKVVESGSRSSLIDNDGTFTLLSNVSQTLVRTSDLRHQQHLDRSRSSVDGVWKKSSDIRLSTNENRTSLDQVLKNSKMTLKKILNIVSKAPPSKFLHFLLVLFSIFAGAAVPIYAFLYGLVLSYLANPDLEYVRTATIMGSLYFVILGSCHGCVIFIRSNISALLTVRLTKYLRTTAFNNCMNKNASWFEATPERSPSVLSDKIATLTSDFQFVYVTIIPNLIECLIIALVGAAISCFFGPKLALVILACVPLILLASHLSLKSASAMEEKLVAFYTEAETIASSYLSNIRTVTSFNLQEEAIRKHDEMIQKGLNSTWRKRAMISFGSGVSEAVVISCEAIAFFWGSYLLINAEYSMSDILIVLTSIVIGANGLSRFVRIMPDMSILSATSLRIGELLKSSAASAAGEKRDLEKGQQKAETKLSREETREFMQDGRIQFSKVSFAYPQRPKETVLNGISFKVAAREKMAIVGTSGSGKSTLILLLEQIYRPTSGSIYFGGRNVKELDLEGVRDNIGWVGQFPVLFNRTIWENVTYGNWQMLKTIMKTHKSGDNVPEEVVEACRKANILDVIESLPDGFDTVVGEEGKQLSGGQRQRLAIARLFLKNPPIYILDEYTSALDNQTEVEVIEAVSHMVTDKTAIIVTHRPGTLTISDSVLVINEGQIVKKMNTSSIENLDEFLGN